MSKQPVFPGLRDAMKKQTRRQLFLAKMDAAVPWTQLLALIEPHHTKAGRKGGRPPMPLPTMLRVYFLQNWYALSDPMPEETLYGSEAMRQFTGIELGDDRSRMRPRSFGRQGMFTCPRGLNFRHLLKRHGLIEAIFADVNADRSDKGITLHSGTLIDAAIIDAPPSPKNKAGARDPGMSSTKKGNDWYFGPPLVVCKQTTAGQRKAHIGVNADSGVTHSIETSTAKLPPAYRMRCIRLPGSGKPGLGCTPAW